MEHASKLPKGLQAFIDHYEQNRKPEGPEIHGANLYLIQTEDMDGNITDEKYGINLITDVGTSRDFTQWAGFNVYFESVDGSNPNPASYLESTMVNYIPNVSMTLTQSKEDYPIEYIPNPNDPNSGIISTRWKVAYGSLDYNITGIDQDLVITGIGIKSGGIEVAPLNGFFSKVTIYDTNAEFSSITKHLNERLTITIYCSTSMCEKGIIDAYDNDHLHIFTLFDLPFRCNDIYSSSYYYLINGQNSSWDLKTSGNDSFKSYSAASYEHNNRGWNLDEGAINDALYFEKQTHLVIGSEVLEDKGKVWSYMAYVRTDGSSRNYIMIDRDMLMTTPEELSIENVYTNDYNSGDLYNAFGANPNLFGTSSGTLTNAHIIPATDFNMTDSKMYNHLTKAWDIQDTFVNAPNAWYGNTWSLSALSQRNVIWMTDENGASTYVCVYVNPRNDIPITSFTQTGGGSTYRIYMTDKYWDASTWVRVMDTSNIDVALQTKKYIVTRNASNPNSQSQNIGNITPTRQQTIHSITPSKAPYQITDITSDPTYTGSIGQNPRGWFTKPLASTTSISWILTRDNILFIDTSDGSCKYQYHLYGADNDTEMDPAVLRYSFDDTVNNISKIAVAPVGNTIPTSIRIYTISAFGTQPTYTDVSINASMGGHMGHYTKSENGYVGIADESTYCASVIDVNNETEIQFTDVSLFHVQEFTNYAIYRIIDSSPQQWVVYDLSTQTVVNTFTLPSEYTTPLMVYGCGQYFYIYDRTNNVNTFFLYNMNTQNVELLTNFSLPCAITTQTYYTWYRNDLYNSIAIYHPEGMTIATTSVQRITEYIQKSPSFINFTQPTVVHSLYKAGTYRFQTMSNGDYRNINYDTRSGALSMITNRTMFPHASIVTSSDQKRVLLINPGFAKGYMESNYTTPSPTSESNYIISDFGYALDTGEELNQCYNHYQSTGSVVNNSYGGMLYFDDGIVVVDGFGQCKWYPLEYMLPHKVTGTTRTYQVYNNPKRIFTSSDNEIGYSLSFTNRPNITTKPSPPSGSPRWYSCMYWYDNGSPDWFIRRNKDEHYISTELIRVPIGSTITVTTQLNSSIIFSSVNPSAQPTLYCNIRAYTDNQINKTMAHLKSYTNALTGNTTTSITISDVTSATGYVMIGINVYANTNYGNYYLTTTMFDTKTVTITPPA